MNNKGFGKFEVLTMIVLLIVISAILLVMILKGANNQKLNVLSTNARNFADKVISDNNGSGTYYLKDAIDEGLYDSIKSPFSTNDCDIYESKVEFKDNKKYVTLKCDEYIIYNEEANSDTYKIYKTSEWLSSKNSDDFQKTVGYNCEKDGKEVLDNYQEERLFLDNINELYTKEYTTTADVVDCKVLSKELFRDLTLVR